MNYSEMLRKAVENADLSLAQIERRLKSLGFPASKSYLSKLQTGVTPPASDKMNEALAEFLGIDPIDLKTAAALVKLPAEVVERIKSL